MHSIHRIPEGVAMRSRMEARSRTSALPRGLGRRVRRQLGVIVGAAALLLFSGAVAASACTVTSVTPNTARPGERVILNGPGFNESAKPPPNAYWEDGEENK